jgi:hypothetical protein
MATLQTVASTPKRQDTLTIGEVARTADGAGDYVSSLSRGAGEVGATR